MLGPFLQPLAGLPNVVGFGLDHRDGLADARLRAGADKVLLTGVHGPTLDRSSPETIHDEYVRILEAGRGDRHLGLATTAADVPLTTTPEAIQAVFRAVDTFAEKDRAAGRAP